MAQDKQVTLVVTFPAEVPAEVVRKFKLRAHEELLRLAVVAHPQAEVASVTGLRGLK